MESIFTSLTTVLSNIRESAKRVSYWLLLIALLLAVTSCQKQKQAAQITRPTPATATSGPRPPGFPPPVMNQPYPATGVVVLINRKEGWIEINHEEIKGLMPAMQMEFWVKNRSLLEKVKAGDQIDFTVVETETGEYLTELKRASNRSPSP